MVFPSSEQCVVFWRRQTLRMSSSEQNKLKCGLSEGTCPENRRISILEFASILRIATGSVQSILKHKQYVLWLATKYVPHTCHSILSINEIKWLSYSSSLLTRSSALGLPLFPKIMKNWKGSRFHYSCHHDPTKILGQSSNCKQCNSQNSSVAQLLGLLHEVPSRLFRRGQHQ